LKMNLDGFHQRGKLREKFVYGIRRQTVGQTVLRAFQNLFVLQKERWSRQEHKSPSRDQSQDRIPGSKPRTKARNHDRRVEDDSPYHCASYRMSHRIGYFNSET
jgi:hypothetical protein